MPNSKSDVLDKTDPSLPNPLLYPGKLNRNNKGGTLLTKQDWIKGEVIKWVTKMKEDLRYDEATHSQKAWVLF